MPGKESLRSRTWVRGRMVVAALACAGLAIADAAPADASQISHHVDIDFTVNLIDRDGSILGAYDDYVLYDPDGITLPQFDPSLGQLLTVVLAADFEFHLEDDLIDEPGFDPPMNLGVYFRQRIYTGPPLYLHAEDPPFDLPPILDFQDSQNGTPCYDAVCNFAFDLYGDDSTVVDLGAVDFVGSDTWTAYYSTDLGASGGPGFDAGKYNAFDYSGSLTLTYKYRVIPEPGTGMLLAAGLAALGLERRRRS